MITLDQVLLLQKKVETAVAKINSLNMKVSQLESENDALRSKCAELTKAFSEKSELVLSLEDTQSKIEQTILSTLTRLDDVENSILDADSGATASENFIEESVAEIPQPEYNASQEIVVPVSNDTASTDNSPAEAVIQDYNTDSVNENSTAQDSEPQNTADINGQFDIF